MIEVNCKTAVQIASEFTLIHRDVTAFDSVFASCICPLRLIQLISSRLILDESGISERGLPTPGSA